MHTSQNLLHMARQLCTHVSTRDDILHRIDIAFLYTYGCHNYCDPCDINDLSQSLIGQGNGHLVYRLGRVTNPLPCFIALRITRACWPSPPDGLGLASDFSAFAASYTHGTPIPNPLAAVRWTGPTKTPSPRTDTLGGMLVRDLTEGGTCDLREDLDSVVRTTNGTCETILIDPDLTTATPTGRTFLDEQYRLTIHSTRYAEDAPHDPTHAAQAINLKRPKRMALS